MSKLKRGRWCIWALLIIAIIIFLSMKPTETAEAEIQNIPETTKVPKEEKMPQVLLDISYAESHDDQTKVGHNYRYKKVTKEDGTIVKEKYLWSKDIGRWQINDFYNKEDCKKAGFDIYTEEGNRRCALKLYNERGTQPWNASKYCWADIATCKLNRGGAYK